MQKRIRTKSTWRVLFCATCFWLFIGCASPPAPHRDWSSSLKPQPGKGLVVFYWNHAGTGMKFYIYANDHLLTPDFHQDSFYTYQADPGPLNVYTKVHVGSTLMVLGDQLIVSGIHRNAPELTIEPNQVYYVEFGNSAFGPARFKKLVSKEEGEDKIKKCEWMNPQ